MLLRIEDTDRTRLVEGSVENMLFVLATVGLIPDEGPNNPWDKWPYFQSERLWLYEKYVQELVHKNHAYYCFCSSERLDELRKEQEDLKLPTKYDGKCRYLSSDELQKNLSEGQPYTIRLKVPQNQIIVFTDLIRGKIEIPSKDVDDQVLMKSDWFPTYHLANVVDDHLMGVTHVIRWEEWVPSTPKHIILYEAFWWEKPYFAHLPLLLGKDKKKLSKRMWDVSVESYLEKGYPTEAILNYIALLGWNPKSTQEFFTMEELIDKFDISQVHKSGAVFDVERLEWFSSKYIAWYTSEALFDKLITYLKRYDTEFQSKVLSFDISYNLKILSEIKGRMKKYSEFKELSSLFYDEKVCDTHLFISEKMQINTLEDAKKSLSIALDILKSKNWDFESIESVKQVFIQEITSRWLKNGQILWPVRVALSCEPTSPGALELIYIFWVKKSIERIDKILKAL